MARKRQLLGSAGENFAAEYLIQKGYLILERNYRTPYGEIDIIAQYNDTLVFVEVKTRSNTAFGNPEDSINARKIDHLTSSIAFYLQERPLECHDLRIDVLALQKQRGKEMSITHFENAISE